MNIVGAFSAQKFIAAIEGWICDQYYVDIRYIALSRQSATVIWSASIDLWPRPSSADAGFSLVASNVRAGQQYLGQVTRDTVLALIRDALRGRLVAHDTDMSLDGANSLTFESNNNEPDLWFYPMDLRVSGLTWAAPLPAEMYQLESHLRTATTPFDGFADLRTRLGLTEGHLGTKRPSIRIRMSPPVDVMFHETTLANGRFHAVLRAHREFDVSKVALALRVAPGDIGTDRFQAKDLITWSRSGLENVGVLDMELSNAHSVLIMLSINDATVRRQWFVDPSRAENDRFIAANTFDSGLRMLTGAVFDATDSTKFEQGVAELLFLVGFSVNLPVEKDAPDILITSFAGRCAVVECTIRTSDLGSKIGKLVHRRNALASALRAANVPSNVSAILVCRLPRDQIAATPEELSKHNVILLSFEALESALRYVRFPTDADELLKSNFQLLIAN